MCSLCSKGILWCLAPTRWHWVFSFCELGGAFLNWNYFNALFFKQLLWGLEAGSMLWFGLVVLEAFLSSLCSLAHTFILLPSGNAWRKKCSVVHVFTSPVSGLNECASSGNYGWVWCVVLREICSLLFLLEIRHITGIPNNEHLGQETT